MKVGCALLLVLFLPTANGQSLTTEEWQEDLDALRSAIVETHPRPFTQVTEEAWTEQFDLMSKQIKSLEDHEIIVGMAELVATLQDGHSRLTLPTIHPEIGASFAHSKTPDPAYDELKFGRLPIEIEEFDDGIFVVKATGEYKTLLGSKVTAIGNNDIDAVSKTVMPAIHAENEQFAKIFLADRLTIPEILHYYELADGVDSAVFEFQSDSGNKRTENLPAIADTPVAWQSIEARLAAPPLWLKHKDRDYWYQIIDDAVYLQYNEVGYDGNHPPVPFVAEMLSEAKKHGATRLVLDLRRNFGGDASWMMPFFRGITRHEVFDRPGGLYVIIGRRTFSAAALMVNELEQHTHAIFVGEATGSKPDTFGDSKKRQLPNSGLTVRISSLFWKNWLAGEFRSAISPHIAAPVTFDDFAHGRDPALDAALSHRMPDSPVEYFASLLTDANVNTAALYISKYLMDPRYGDQDLENPMLELGYRFLRDGDATNAYYTFLLAETYYSRSADVLAGLGLALEKLERNEQAIETYQRALTRNENHEDAQAGLKRLTD